MKYNGVRVELNPDEIKCENLSGAYKDMAEIIGIDAVIKIHGSYRGQTVCFPVELFSKKYISSQIINDYKLGLSIKQLATKYAYSEKSIRKILKYSEEEV